MLVMAISIISLTYGIISLWLLILIPINARYEPNWKSLDARPLPAWYDEGKLGIFMHWGVYSVPSYVDEWFWNYWISKKDPRVVAFMKQNYRPDFTYQDFASQFSCQLFNPNRFAKVVQQSGAKYYILTSKHHEGYTMWPSKYSWNWNAKDVGPARDIIGELATAFQQNAPDVKFGLYFSLFEWYNPLYLQDKNNSFKSSDYVNDVSYPQLLEIVNQYKPQVVWADGDAGPDTYWRSTDFLAWLYNDSPVKDTVVTNDRWGGTACKHGGYYTCMDRYNPGKLQNHKWENAMTVYHIGWGYRRDVNIEDFYTTKQLIKTFAGTISCGGNMAMNIGPTPDGRIDPLFEERLMDFGSFMRINAEAIYSSKPWIYQNDTTNSNVWYTSKLSRKEMMSGKHKPSRLFNPQLGASTIVYAFMLEWPDNGILKIGAPTATSQTKVSMLGYSGSLLFAAGEPDASGITVDLTGIKWWKLPSTLSWVLKFENLAPSDRRPI